MGLDMYMSGRKMLTSWQSGYTQRSENGYEIEEITVKLGYWRKHPNLHGYIVANFGPKDEAGNPVDDCNKIDLTQENIEQIIKAIEDDRLEDTSGFFFGSSYRSGDEGYEEQKKEDLEVMGHCLQWLLLAATQKDAWYDVSYRASW